MFGKGHDGETYGTTNVRVDTRRGGRAPSRPTRGLENYHGNKASLVTVEPTPGQLLSLLSSMFASIRHQFPQQSSDARA